MKRPQKKHQKKFENKGQKPKTIFLSKHQIYILMLMLLTALIFSNSLKNGFTNWDDNKYLFDNKFIKDLSFNGIKNIFSEAYFFNYHPITTLSYAIEYNFFGLNPKIFHFTNYILHILNTLLVFFFIKLLSKRDEISFITALLFAVHPMHVESVAWISERKDVLYTFFFLASLIYLVKFIQNGYKNIKYAFFAFILFLFSLMSKSAAVTLPLTLLLCIYFLNKKIILKDFLLSLPFFALSLLFGIIALKTQETAMGDLSTIYANINRVLIVTFPIFFYIIRFILPLNFSTLHLFPKLNENILPIEYYIAPFVLIVLIVLIFISKKEFRQTMIFGFLFFIINVALIIQIIAVGQAIVAERYTYVPYIGLSFIGAYTFIKFKDMYHEKSKIFLFAGVIYISFLMITTWQQNKVWKDSLSLWKQAIAVNPVNEFAYCFRANEKINLGDKNGGLEDYNKAIEINPKYAVAYNNRANNLTDRNKAIADYDMAIELLPNYAEAYYNRGNAKFTLLKYSQALADYNKAVDLKFFNATIYHNRGATKNQLGDFKNAITDFNKAMEINPNYADAFKNRGAAYYNLKDITNACIDWKKAKEMGSDVNELLKYCK